MNLFGTALGFAGFFKSRDYGSARIDNIPFRLHYSFTSGFLFLATALLGLNDLFGKEIQCHSNSGGASQAIEQYCWVSGTYIVPDSVGLDENTVGIGPYKKCLMPDEKTILECAREDETCDERNKGSNDVNLGMCAETQSYYQWVPFILMFQGLVFIIPHKIWEIIEEGKMKSITDGVRIGTSIISEDKEQKSTIKNISKFIHRQNKSSGHAKYAYGFFFCLVLSLINVIFNFVFLDIVFKSKFRTLGVRWIKEHFSMENRVLRDIFPRMTACVWTDFGTGGVVQYKNFVCIMAANILNEKIFIFLWFWFIILILGLLF
ncbi:innexin inx3 [Eurytemora carolleeae]|uniref:innexin inx3 n=1 Tax=Eurytemora carolleeae TaxID=1294199 RepID=UPI000C770D66|nr:innexin inx3 [Eurytemora carolleeae]|eukprot:XP_023331313.1 innexin inx3-like [Eurytemora affinis]